MTQHRSRAALNAGMHELETIIPELDIGERAQLIGMLGTALVELIGPRGMFSARHDGKLYDFAMTLVGLVYDPDQKEPQ